MMDFDAVKQENVPMLNGGQNSASYLSNAGGSGVYDDLEGQLFGPIPPYMTQGQQNFDFQAQADLSRGMMPGLNPQDMNYHTGLTPNGDMNFVLSGDGGEWGNMLADQRYRQ